MGDYLFVCLFALQGTPQPKYRKAKNEGRPQDHDVGPQAPVLPVRRLEVEVELGEEEQQNFGKLAQLVLKIIKLIFARD